MNEQQTKSIEKIVDDLVEFLRVNNVHPAVTQVILEKVTRLRIACIKHK